MSACTRMLTSVVMLGFFIRSVAAQEIAAPPKSLLQDKSAPAGVAATVNGQQITETAVQRGLKRLPKEKQTEARTEILDFLIDNVLVDQHLQQLRIEVDKKEIEARFEQMRNEIKKSGQTYEKVLEQLQLTEEELRAQLTAELRWEKYCQEQVKDLDLQNFFDKNREMFDGSMVRGRHILIAPPTKDALAGEQAKKKVTQMKEQLEEDVARELAKLPAGTENLVREKARTRYLDDAFAKLARAESSCPSKEQGGDLGWFPRAGSMVEPFARAAFALKPYELSEAVATPFGYHLILVTDLRKGKETKFEDIKEVVRDVYSEQIRTGLCGRLKVKARIEIAGKS